MTTPSSLEELREKIAFDSFIANLVHAVRSAPEESLEDFNIAKEMVRSHMEAVIEHATKPIEFEWKPYNVVNHSDDPEEQSIINGIDRLVCTVCGDMKDDPEVGHSCEVTNRVYSDVRQRAKSYLEGER